jgi:hypothetical protein
MSDEDIVKLAMTKVKEILDKYEVAAVVAIHIPGYSESLLKINTPFSCARQEEGRIKISAKLEEFKGDKNVRKKKLFDTADMFHQLSDTCTTAVYPCFEISERLDEILKEEYPT